LPTPELKAVDFIPEITALLIGGDQINFSRIDLQRFDGLRPARFTVLGVNEGNLTSVDTAHGSHIIR
jgi:hypothetical protein